MMCRSIFLHIHPWQFCGIETVLLFIRGHMQVERQKLASEVVTGRTAKCCSLTALGLWTVPVPTTP